MKNQGLVYEKPWHLQYCTKNHAQLNGFHYIGMVGVFSTWNWKDNVRFQEDDDISTQASIF